MSSDIPEADWRRFRELHKILLERFCAQTLAEVGVLIERSHGTAHERYLALYKLIRDRDKALARAFDDLRRSTATLQLSIMRRMGLLTDAELGLLSERTRERVETMASL